MEETETVTPSRRDSQTSLNKLEKEASNISACTIKAVEEEKDKDKDDQVSYVNRMLLCNWLNDFDM